MGDNEWGTKSRYNGAVRKEVDRLRRYLLPGWSIELAEQPFSDEDEEFSKAMISWADHRFCATLWLSDLTLGGSMADLQTTIAHELVHPLFRGLRTQYMPDEETDPADHELWVHFEEMIVERLSLALTGREDGGSV